MSKHTAGPWRAVNDGPFIATEHNTVIAKIVCSSNEGNVLNCQTGTPADFETIANARLIAAAPDMLEALETLFKECAMVHRFGGSICNQKEADAAIEAAKAAISKAKGE